MGRSFFWFIYSVLLFAIPTNSQASEVVFRLNIGEEAFEINCATNEARIREMSALVAGHELEVNRLRQLRRTKGLVEGENLLLLTLRFKIGFIRQNLTVLEFGQHYCVHQNELKTIEGFNLEDIIMQSSE